MVLVFAFSSLFVVEVYLKHNTDHNLEILYIKIYVQFTLYNILGHRYGIYKKYAEK